MIKMDLNHCQIVSESTKIYPKLLAAFFATSYLIYLAVSSGTTNAKIDSRHLVFKRLITPAIPYLNHSYSSDSLLTAPVILAWTTFFEENLIKEALLKGADEPECPYKCIYSDDKQKYNSNASVIIFHIRNLNQSDLPTENPNQLKVFFLQESPAHSGNSYKKMPANYFNLTMTYRKDSDIFLPYDTFDKIAVNKTVAEEVWQENEIVDKLKKKSKLALLLVSNCNTSSKREKYVEELKKHMNISEFGKCSNISCPGNACRDQKIDEHFFYLAFENSICKQYITEKFWNIKRLIVPVVLSRKPFKGLEIPSDAYIAAEDFPSARQLAERLIYLKSNPDEYIKLLSWTKTYKKTSSTEDPLCKLCQMAIEKKTKTIKNIFNFWERDGKCMQNFTNKILTS